MCLSSFPLEKNLVSYLCCCFAKVLLSHLTSLLQFDLKIVFHPWVMKSVHVQLLRLQTFSLRRFDGKGDFAAYQPMINALVRIGHHSGV